MLGRNLDCLKEDLFSAFGVVVPSLLLMLLFPELLIRKKFLSF